MCDYYGSVFDRDASENFPIESTFARSATGKHERSKVQEIELELVLDSNARRAFWTRVLSLSLSLLAARHTFARSATGKHERSKVQVSQIGQTIKPVHSSK